MFPAPRHLLGTRIEESVRRFHMHRVLIVVEHVLIAVEHLAGDDRGQDLLEYGLLVTLIAVAALVGVGLLGTSTTTLWTPIDTFVRTI
jgi:Flp pilus assembly pilin Flp